MYVGPNTDTGFLDAVAEAVNEDKSQQISISWGESETAINYFVQQGQETPEYMNAFNQIFMQAASQGVSMFAQQAMKAHTTRLANLAFREELLVRTAYL